MNDAIVQKIKKLLALAARKVTSRPSRTRFVIVIVLLIGAESPLLLPFS